MIEPQSRPDCEELIFHNDSRYQEGLQKIEATRPQSIITLKAQGIDFEEDRPKVLAPPDAYRWLGLVALTREAGENVKVLKQRLSEFEAQDAGAEKHASQVPRHQEPYLRSMLSIITAVSAKTVQRLSATYAAFKENAWHTWITIRSPEEATAGEPHLEAAPGVQSDEQQPLLAPLSGLSAEGLRQRLLASTSQRMEASATAPQSHDPVEAHKVQSGDRESTMAA